MLDSWLSSDVPGRAWQYVMEVEARLDKHTHGVCVVRAVPTMLIRLAETRGFAHAVAAASAASGGWSTSISCGFMSHRRHSLR